MLKVAIVGRTQWLYKTVRYLVKKGHSIPLIVTAPAAPEYTKKEDDFEKLAFDIGAKFYLAKSLNSPELLKKMKGLDVAVSINWPTIIQQKYIDCFRLGILNAHMGDLPCYRGNACPNWAIINGEKEITVSIHLMEGGKLDCGRVIVQDRMSISENTYIGNIYAWAEMVTPELFEETLKLLRENPNCTLKYADSKDLKALRCYPRIPSDNEIDWNKSSVEIHRLIRASSEPFAGAYTYLDNKRLTIWRAEIVRDSEKYCAIPGQVARIDKKEGSVTIITGNAKLKLLLVSYNAKVRIKPAMVIKSIRQRLE